MSWNNIPDKIRFRLFDAAENGAIEAISAEDTKPPTRKPATPQVAPIAGMTPLGAKPAALPDEQPRPETGASDSSVPEITLAHALLARLNALKLVDKLTAKEIQAEATKVYGSALAEGKFDRKDLTDALELAVNIRIRDNPEMRVGADGDWKGPMDEVESLLHHLPTQRVRSEEQESFQQFSTPPNYALAAAYAVNLHKGDVLLEPSAGTGSLVAAASMPGVKIIANELSERRAALLRELVGKSGEVITENAEQLNNILPDSVKPTVVLMNPPFSQTAGRLGDKKDLMVAANHIDQALARLEPGGRLVAIVGGGMVIGQPKYRAWFAKLMANNTLRANIGVDGKVYAKYGTSFYTRLLVIDKVKPQPGMKPETASVQSADELMRLLETIRDARPSLGERPAAEQHAVEPGGAVVAKERAEELRPGAPSSLRPATGGEGAGVGGQRGVGGPGSGRAGEPGDANVRVETGQRPEVAAVQPERPGAGRAGGDAGKVAAPRAQSEVGSGDRTQRDLQPATGGQSGAAARGQQLELEHAEPGSQAATEEISESLYDTYRPQRVRVPGAKAHPSKLVESAAMASVPPPKPTYQPHLPKAVISKGQLSEAQIEPVIYAGEAHGQMLPAQEGSKAKRKGFFIGDGTGVGKGREVAGIILDNFAQGRRKAVWVSEKKTLLQDAKRDWSGLGQNPNLLFDVGKVKTGEPVQAKEGVGFITYDTLKGGMSDQAALARGQFIRKQQVQVNGQSGKVEKVERNKKGDILTVKLDNGTTITAPAKEVTALEKGLAKSRVDQLVDWFGEDFDGVIAFDEAHNMGNATDIKGERGQKDAAQKAIAGMALQERLPNARVVYVSATGATEVSNLAYADRLGLWGRGTPFASREKFVTEVQKGGIAAMELIARDMKQLGLYTARNLSYDGVEYERVEHALDTNQREIYNTLAEAWQHVLTNINAALEVTGGGKDSRAKSAALSAFWGGHQRFFNQIVTSMQMPTVLKAVEKDIAEGRQVVLQLTNTNEASQERAVAKAQTAEDIEDLDITPRDQIIQLVEHSFPTQQYEQYVDDNGKTRARPVVDKAGNPVQNKEAVVVRDRLIDELASVRVPQGPLDMILDHFGTDVVSEVTGRGRRFVRKRDEKTGEMRRVEESRPASSNIAETDAFQGGKKKILVFSEAGGTGRSYHADLTAASKDARRVHYLLQGGWRADKAVQGFGRSHRSNQASAPIFKLVTTDLKGQKRFISSIARRLGQLGALTKGQRQAGDQGIFSARDNLESTEANRALDAFFRDLLADKIEGVTVKDFEKQTGLKLRNEDDEGRVSGGKMELPPVTQFLNRLLSLKVDFQNKVFDAFSDRLDAVIEARRQAGLLDVGLETVKADKIAKVSEQTVHTVKGTDADTKYVKIALSDKFVPVDFETVARNESRPVKAWVKSPNDKVYAVTEGPDITDENGAVFANYRVTSPVSGSRMIHRINIDRHDSKWSKIDRGQAKSLWGDETAQAPKYVTRDMHLITGAILPIWDRLSGNPRVVRLQTDKGERFIGRVVPNDAIATTLKALGAENKATKVSPVDLYAKLRQGGRVKLANGWMLQRSLVAGEHRIELKGPSSFSEGQEAKQDGAFTEKIDYKLRYFVPMDNDKGPEVLRKLTEYRPVTDVSDAASAPDDMAAGEGPMFAVRPGATDSPQFKRWFGKSKVVDADGKPMVVYHGTNNNFDRFSKDKLGSATGARSAKMGFFFTNNTDLSSSYADNENPYEQLPVIRQVNALTRGKYQNFNEAVLRALGMESQLPSGQNVMPVYLRITNPLEVDFDGEGPSSDKPYSEIIAKAKAAGHDGVFIRGTMDPGFSEYAGGKGGAYQPSDLFIAFEPEQIKSATGNSGAFDANNPRIDMAVRAGPLTMRGTGAVEARGSFTGDFTAHAKAIGGLLRAELDRLGLKDIGLNLVDRLEIWMKGERAGTADGVYFEKAITLALDGGDKFKILHHEALHALRSLGLFKDTEYAILAQQSQRTWRKQFKIDEGYGNRSEDTKTEEGITHAYAAWANGEMKVDGRMARLFKRIRDFLEALRNAFRGNGFKTAEDVFRDIKSGKVGERDRGPGEEAEPQFSVKEEGQIAHFQKYYRSMKFASEAEGRAAIRRNIIRTNEQYKTMFPETDPNIVDKLKFVRSGNGFKLSQRGLSPPRMPVEIHEEPTGNAPNVDWTARDNINNGSAKSAFNNYGRGKGVATEGYIDVDALPKEQLAGGERAYDWSELERSSRRSSPPPATVRLNQNGSVSILDGNHRIKFWRDQGYEQIPAFIIDERTRRDDGEEPMFSMRSTAVPTPKLDARIREGIANALDWAKPKADKFIEGMQDLSHPMKLLQQDLEIRRAAAFDDPENFYQRKRLYPGRLGAWVDSFNKRHLDGIVKLLKANGVDLKDAGDVLYAMHAPERNAEMGKINENLEAGSGMSDEEAAKIIADAKASGQWPAYEDLRDRVAAVRELILTVMERAGLEKPEVIADWRKTYNDYVPLRGWEEAPDDAPPNYGPASGFNIRGKEVKRAYGRRSKADNPLVNLFDQAYRTFDRAERNRYLQSVYRALDNVGPDASDIAKLDKGKPKKSIDPKTGMVRTTETSPLFNDPHAVFLKFDGNPHFIVFKDRDLAEATKRMSPAGIGAFEGLLKFQNKMKALWTHYSPDFLLRHFLFRYPIEGTLNSFEQKESGDHKVSQYVKDAIPFLGDASKAIFASQKGVTHDNPRIAAMQKSWEEMRRAGGAMVFRNMRDVDLLREHLETALKDLSNSPVANARAKWRHMVEAMDAVTNALDNSLRLAAYASARKQGKTPEQAALIAREATVDFQLKGNFAKGMGLFFVFGNVAVQTAARISKATHRSKMMRRVFMGTMLASFLLGAYNYLMGGEDKDGVPFFEKIPEWERRLNLIILNPFDKDAKGRPQPIKIPLPYNWAFPVVLGYLMATSIFGKESVRKRLAMFTKSAMETFTPMGSEENKVAAVTPELARPFVHTYTNEDWAGRPIHSDDHYQKGPNAYSPRRNTGEGWKKFAEILNSASGGSRGKSGLVDLYPEDYRELIDHFIGTQIRLGSNTYDTLGSIMKGEAPKATSTPLGRVIYGTDYDAADRARGYELRDQRKHPWKAH